MPAPAFCHCKTGESIRGYAAFLQNAPVVRHTRGFTPGWYAVPRWGTPNASPLFERTCERGTVPAEAPPQTSPRRQPRHSATAKQVRASAPSPRHPTSQKIFETDPFCVNRWDRPRRRPRRWFELKGIPCASARTKSLLRTDESAGRRRAYGHGPGESVTRGDRQRSEQGLEALRRRSPARANARRVESPEPKKRRFAPKPESGPIFLPHIGQFFIAHLRASLRSDHCPISSDQCPIRIGTGVRFHRNTQQSAPTGVRTIWTKSAPLIPRGTGWISSR